MLEAVHQSANLDLARHTGL